MFPNLCFPFQSSKSDMLHLMAPTVTLFFLIDTIRSAKLCQRFFEKPLFLYSTAKTRDTTFFIESDGVLLS